jgi:hypothetical protein
MHTPTRRGPGGGTRSPHLAGLWWAARTTTTTTGVRLIAAILAAPVVGEVARVGVYLVLGKRQPYIWALPAPSAAVTVWLMLLTMRIDPPESGPTARPTG